MNDRCEHRVICQDQTCDHGWQSPIYRSSEPQALETFKHSAEERRFVRHERWTITNYALIAYAALAAAPTLVEPVSWRSPVSWICFALVLLAGVQAWRLLADQQDRLDMELDRQRGAVNHLRLIRQIHKDNPHYVDVEEKKPRKRKYRKWYQIGWPTEWRGFALILVLGAAVASLVIFSRIPWVQQVLGDTTQSAPDLPDQALLWV